MPKRTRSQLSAAAALGLSCAILAFLISWIHSRSGSSCRSPDSRNHTPTQLYKPVDNSSSSGVSGVSVSTSLYKLLCNRLLTG